MQDERVSSGVGHVWLNRHGHREFLHVVTDEGSGLYLFQNFHAKFGCRVLIRKIGPQMNVMVHADYIPERGMVSPLVNHYVVVLLTIMFVQVCFWKVGSRDAPASLGASW